MHWSFLSQLITLPSRQCFLNRILSLDPRKFERQLLYHVSNNKQRTISPKKMIRVGDYYGQTIKVKERAEAFLRKGAIWRRYAYRCCAKNAESERLRHPRSVTQWLDNSVWQCFYLVKSWLNKVAFRGADDFKLTKEMPFAASGKYWDELFWNPKWYLQSPD